MGTSNRGFSSLTTLVTKIDSDEEFEKKIKIPKKKYVPEEKQDTKPNLKPEKKVTTNSNSKVKYTEDKSDGTFVKLILIALICGFIWWALSSTNKDSSSKEQYSNETKKSLKSSTQVAKDSYSLQKDYALVKPSIGKSNVLTVSEIKWCLTEKVKLQKRRQDLINNRGQATDVYLDFNDLTSDFNDRCAEYRYKEYDFNLASWQIKNRPKKSDCFTENIVNGNEKFENKELIGAIVYYQKANVCSTTKKQKTEVLGSLAVALFENGNLEQSKSYISELLTISPENKWAKEFKVKLEPSKNSISKQEQIKSQNKLPVKNIDNVDTRDKPEKQVIDKNLIKNVQELLNLLGYKAGFADGISGKKTEKAIKEFQRKSGLGVTGKITEQLLFSLQKQLKLNNETRAETSNSKKQAKPNNSAKVAAEKLAVKKAEYHRKWQEAQSKKIKQTLPTKERVIKDVVLSSETRENLNTCLKYADSPILCKQHLLTQSQKIQVLNAQKRANLNTCLKHADSPILCKLHLLTQSQKTQVLNAQKRAN